MPLLALGFEGSAPTSASEGEATGNSSSCLAKMENMDVASIFFSCMLYFNTGLEAIGGSFQDDVNIMNARAFLIYNSTGDEVIGLHTAGRGSQMGRGKGSGNQTQAQREQQH
jgi:hypothetical protein